jgi:hypothetical protein
MARHQDSSLEGSHNHSGGCRGNCRGGRWRLDPVRLLAQDKGSLEVTMTYCITGEQQRCPVGSKFIRCGPNSNEEIAKDCHDIQRASRKRGRHVRVRGRYGKVRC